MIQVKPEPHLFTVEEYMSLDIPERTELLNGVIYDLSPVNPPHTRAVRRLAQRLSRALDPDRYEISVQDPIAVAGWKGKQSPAIDVAVIQAKPYERTPTGEDSFAFVEVSDTTYAFDRGTKIPIYVAAGVPSWIVNIPMRQVEWYAPNGTVLGDPVIFRDEFEILGVRITVARLLDA